MAKQGVTKREKLDMSGLSPDVRKKLGPFFEKVLGERAGDVQSIYVTGSAATDEFFPDRSDFNTLFILHRVAVDFLDFLAPLGRRFGPKRIRAPMIMTAEYIERSLDVYPVEFLEYKRANRLVFGEDVLAGITIDKANLRLQVERELKGRLINLRHGYVRAAGRRKFIRQLMVDIVPGVIPLLSSLLFIMDREIPARKLDIITAAGELLKVGLEPVARCLQMRRSGEKPGLDELKGLFTRFYLCLETLTDKVDKLHV